ncbi:MAG: hypothetical protein HQM08_19140 [Candidatus Riflebacteria bacterium]|nr:hypothetical protein [Candidatus Riflebacteria bacterium]
MLTVKGIYKKGEVILLNNVEFDKQMDVLITFLDDLEKTPEEKLKAENFSFSKSRQLLAKYKGSLSQAIIEERRRQI